MCLRPHNYIEGLKWQLNISTPNQYTNSLSYLVQLGNGIWCTIYNHPFNITDIFVTMKVTRTKKCLPMPKNKASTSIIIPFQMPQLQSVS